MRKGMQTRTCNTQFSVRNEGGRRIEGYFAVFGKPYEPWPGAVENVDPHAFDDALGDDIRALINHETRLVLGRTAAGTLRMRVDEHGLWGEIDINEADSDAMNLYARVQRGDVSQCSFGFEILEEDTEYGPGMDEVRFTIKRVKLYEVSCVTFPAYTDTAISARAAQYAEMKKRQMQVWRETMKGRLNRWHSDK